MMKYQDSLVDAEKKSGLSLKQLKLWSLPASPINYTVAYEYTSQNNKPLVNSIDSQISHDTPVDSFFIEETFKQYVLGQSSLREDFIDDVESIVSSIEKQSVNAANSTSSFIKEIDRTVEALHSNDAKLAYKALVDIKQESLTLKQEYERLVGELALAHDISSALNTELEDIQKDIFLDPLTGFYNRKAMLKRLGQWQKDATLKTFSLIIVRVNQFDDLVNKFGPLISDVLLSKISNKVRSYIEGSGYPIRTGRDEFMILLPKIEKSLAFEIAEKIEQGVHKLRFVSSKSGIRLPQITISLEVGQFSVADEADAIIAKARRMLELSNGAEDEQVAFV